MTYHINTNVMDKPKEIKKEKKKKSMDQLFFLKDKKKIKKSKSKKNK